ncbi:MAG TPA: DUF4038 domain-containing protein [Bryobacteraceae bacterium]|nr:DUF4038 domain-containing protein [Bryobacteraceae bacterium]
MSRRIALLLAALTALLSAAPASVSFSQPSPPVEVYDFIEIAARVASPDAANCFTDAALTGSFERPGAPPVDVEGFCDAMDGSVYRIRYMPSGPGDYRYRLRFRQGSYEQTQSGAFRAVSGHRRGPIRVDAANPWHFVWEGSGEHYFFNGTTAFWLMGWKDERIIRSSIERLHRLKVNRIRVDISGRSSTFYGEPVMNGPAWSLFLAPYVAENSSDFSHPGFDWRRFNVDYWQKYDRMLRFARDRDMIMSLILDMNDSGVHPAAGSEDERRYIRYAIARFAAFSNITWDLGDDLDAFRNDAWTHATGTFIKEVDPYKHLATSHPVDPVHQDRTSAWFDFTSFQEWSREQHRFMLMQRKKQQELGRPIPQTNEEYGYEDHYPLWAKGPGSESADVLRRTAWDIYMAGGYQTAGETARRGTNIWPDMGGGWMNGRGDDTMTMFLGYGHIVDFFTAFDWWKTEPHDELVTSGDYCLAQPGRLYAVYLPNGGKVTVKLEPGRYRAEWFEAETGERVPIEAPVNDPSWTSPEPPGRNDWALLISASQ